MDVIRQSIPLTFRYGVYFTTGLFSVDNLILHDVVTGEDDPVPAEVLVVIDGGVAQAHLELDDQIVQYARAHCDVLRLAGPILTIPGGEQAKNEPRHLETLQ